MYPERICSETQMLHNNLFLLGFPDLRYMLCFFMFNSLLGDWAEMEGSRFGLESALVVETGNSSRGVPFLHPYVHPPHDPERDKLVKKTKLKSFILNNSNNAVTSNVIVGQLFNFCFRISAVRRNRLAEH